MSPSNAAIALFSIIPALIMFGIGLTIPIIGLVILNRIHKTLEKIEQKMK